MSKLVQIGMLLFSCTVWGEDQVINQSEQNNVAGVIQFGPFANVDIIQIGDYNRTAVVQLGIEPIGTITQEGNYNRAVVFQISDTSTLKIFQNGVFLQFYISRFRLAGRQLVTIFIEYSCQQFPLRARDDCVAN
jgi:hypothetical protein